MPIDPNHPAAQAPKAPKAPAAKPAAPVQLDGVVTGPGLDSWQLSPDATAQDAAAKLRATVRAAIEAGDDGSAPAELGGPTYEVKAPKRKLGLATELEDGGRLELNPTFKRGGGVKVEYSKKF